MRLLYFASALVIAPAALATLILAYGSATIANIIIQQLLSR